MSLSIAIVGLPNAGKSTLFNALLKKRAALAENYPFCTIEPNTGIVDVPDSRLKKLAHIVKTNRIIPATIEFVDVAGLVKGAHRGEGLGNKFLAHIRETSAIAYVLRFFEDSDIIHVSNEVDPINDIQILEQELILADLQTLEKQKEPRGNTSKEEKEKWETVLILKQSLNKGIPAVKVNLSEHQQKYAQELMLITLKKTLYVANVSESQLAQANKMIKGIEKYANGPIITLSAKLESELIDLTEPERKELLSSVGIRMPALDVLAKKGYEALNRISFLTAGQKEVRAWTIEKGSTAQKAAGVIHSDFEKHFIKADIVAYNDFISHNGWEGCKKRGLVKSQGKNYVIKEGNIVEFKIGST